MVIEFMRVQGTSLYFVIVNQIIYLVGEFGDVVQYLGCKSYLIL